MKRLSLSLQLALILAAAMITSLLTVVYVDWVNRVYQELNHNTGEADRNALHLLELRAKLTDEQFATAVRLTIRPDNWVFYGDWQGLHPWDERIPSVERDIRRTRQVSQNPVDGLIIASRSIIHYRPDRPDPGGPVRSAPRLLSIGDDGRLFTREAPPEGKPRSWAIHPELDEAGNVIKPVYRLPDGTQIGFKESRVDIYTIALQPAGRDDWIVIYKKLRKPPIAGTLSIAIYSLIAGIAVAGLALLVGRRVMAPFHRVAQQAELLGRGERAPEVPVEGPKDVREIVAAFNSMNARVGQATDYQIGLLHSLGHDLKGPLASVARLVGDVSPNETRTQIEHRLGRVQSIVDAIMSFSRAVMRDGALEVIDLASLLDAITDEQADLGFDVQSDTPERLLVTFRANAMERCLRNLVENAVRHGGGKVRARLFAEPDEVIIQIDDSGPGIPEDEIENAFQPFFRLADEEHGSGLGLAIARTIVIDQGGSLNLTNRPKGGLRAELRLPLSHLSS